MKLKKIAAIVAASALAVTSMSVFANAADSYTATLGFADGSWSAQDWETSIEVNGNGTYSITAAFAPLQDEETGEEYAPDAVGVSVFVVDIANLGKDLGIDQDEDYDMSKVTVSDVTVTVDGTAIAVDQSKILWGDPEDKGNLRIEIFNKYGSTTTGEAYDAAISPINPDDVNGSELVVSFTLSGLPEDAAADEEEPAADDDADAADDDADAAETTEAEAPSAGDTNTSTEDKNTPDTGVEGVAVAAGIAVIAAGAIVIAKKRK